MLILIVLPSSPVLETPNWVFLFIKRGYIVSPLHEPESGPCDWSKVVFVGVILVSSWEFYSEAIRPGSKSSLPWYFL